MQIGTREGGRCFKKLTGFRILNIVLTIDVCPRHPVEWGRATIRRWDINICEQDIPIRRGNPHEALHQHTRILALSIAIIRYMANDRRGMAFNPIESRLNLSE